MSVAPPIAQPWIWPSTGLGHSQIFMNRLTLWPMNCQSRTGSQAPSRGLGPGALYGLPHESYSSSALAVSFPWLPPRVPPPGLRS